MSQTRNKITHITKQLLAVVFLLAAIVLPVMGQGSFQSGSTGTDGAFNPTTSQSIVVPESGVFNFTTVTIPSGVTITFTPNSKNSPVTILATSDVAISGTINVAGKSSNTNGSGGFGGPGGFAGGNGGYGVADLFTGGNGSGPGGGRGGAGTNGSNGTAAGGASYSSSGGQGSALSPAGNRYGSGLLQPIIGGSGGGGGSANTNTVGSGGGGGGGAIIIASSTAITLNSTAMIDARGGSSLNTVSTGFGGGGGSGGAIRLIANTLSGNGTLAVAGGSGFGAGGSGGSGFIRAEGFTTTGFTPSTPFAIAGISTPNPVVLTNAPQLKILSVAGINAPANTIGSLVGAPDIVVPSSQANPVTVVLEGRNLPANIFATLTVTSVAGTTTTSTSSAFNPTATPNVTSANATVTLPAGISVIGALAAVDLALAKLEPMFIDGEKVDRIEITAVFGGESQTTYITSTGKKIIQ